MHPPAEGHIDHIVNNYFVVKALQELLRAGAISPDLEVRVDRIFDPKGHPATPYRYEDPRVLCFRRSHGAGAGGGMVLPVAGRQPGRGEYCAPGINCRRSEGYRKVLDWKEHEGWNEKE